MKKLTKTLMIMAMMIFTFALAVPVSAAEANYTGWSIESGRPMYFVNGSITTNSWVQYGNVCYYLGADGNVVPNMVIAADLAAASGISVMTTNPTVVTAEYSKAAPAIAVGSDYDAFKLLHPEMVNAYGADETGLYGAYLSTYGGAPAGSYYLDCISRYEYSLYNTHHFNAYYGSNGDGTHKAYCTCGEWIEESCDHDANTSKKRDKCSRCGFGW